MKKQIKTVILPVVIALFFSSGCGREVEEYISIEKESAALSETDEMAGDPGEYPDEKDEVKDNGSASLKDLSENTQKAGTESEKIFVFVCGAVNNPGVYSFDSGSRVFEAIRKAGGFSEEADENYLNQARVLTDGEQLRVFTRDETSKLSAEDISSKPAEGSYTEAVSGDLVNINTADKKTLETLNGIGSARADAIIEYREKNGPFDSIEEIKNVSGIKDSVFNSLKDNITVG